VVSGQDAAASVSISTRFADSQAHPLRSLDLLAFAGASAGQGSDVGAGW
jgi:hypothetical protein